MYEHRLHKGIKLILILGEILPHYMSPLNKIKRTQMPKTLRH